MSARASSIAPRAVLAVALFLVLAGPSAGAVGDCSSSSAVANAAQFCTERETWICARALANNCFYSPDPPEPPAMFCEDGTVTMEEASQCVTDAEVGCMGANWAVGCAPSQAAADACIAALMDAGNLSMPDPPMGFPQCDLCPGASGSSLVWEE